MSLFKWSSGFTTHFYFRHRLQSFSFLVSPAPERRKADRILPIIPSEIYISIFEYIAPPTGRLAPEELETFTNLSHVCRFFANFCLPRMFELVEFSGFIFRNDTPAGLCNDSIYDRASRGAALCTQITKKHPLALSLAKRVRICHFAYWELDVAGSWAARLFLKKYIAGMSLMKNIWELKFSASSVYAEHWNAIATLESLEELSFDYCRFLQGPADVEPEEWVKVKVSCLRVTKCLDRAFHPIAAIDPRYLRTLAMEFWLSHEQDGGLDWLSQSALTELHICNGYNPQYIEQVPVILRRVPQSVEALLLFVDFDSEEARLGFRSMFDKTVCKELPLLRSLTLKAFYRPSDTPACVLSLILDCIAPATGLQSLTLKGYMITRKSKISPTDARHILHDKLGPASSLGYVDVFGKAFRLVAGEWSEVSCSTA